MTFFVSEVMSAMMTIIELGGSREVPTEIEDLIELCL
jgi:hypothetical protein